MKKNNKFLYFLLFIIIIVLLYSIYSNKEGFYTSDNTTNAITKLNEILNGNIDQLKTIITDINNQKYQLSINDVINILNNEYGPDSKLNNPELYNSSEYIKIQIKNIVEIQKNLNIINQKLETLFEGARVEIYDINTQTNDTFSLLESINKTILDIKKISNSLNQIPS